MDSGWLFKNCSSLIYFRSLLKLVRALGWSKSPSDLSLKLNSPHLEHSPIFSHPLNKLKSDGCLQSVAGPWDLWLSTCGKLLSAGAVPGCWNSWKAALVILSAFVASNLCSFSSFLPFCQTCCALQQTQLKVLWGPIDLGGISCVLGGRQVSCSGELQGLNALQGQPFIWLEWLGEICLNPFL